MVSRYLGVTILIFWDSRLSTAMISAIYDIIVSIRRYFKYKIKCMYHTLTTLNSEINYFCMQVLQGSCVGKKQLLQTVASNRAEFLDVCRSVRQTFHKKELTVTSINKPMVYKCLHSPILPSPPPPPPPSDIC